MLILQFFIRERLIVCNLDERVRSVPVGKAAFCESIDRKLDDLALKELGMRMTPITDLIGEGKNQKCMADVEIERVSSYACEDTDAAWRLMHLVIPKIREQEMDFLYEKVPTAKCFKVFALAIRACAIAFQYIKYCIAILANSVSRHNFDFQFGILHKSSVYCTNN